MYCEGDLAYPVERTGFSVGVGSSLATDLFSGTHSTHETLCATRRRLIVILLPIV
jgi:hypothetical protein